MSLYASVCNNTIVMWPLFIELIVSFYVKITQENLCNTGKTQGISFWLECGHPELTNYGQEHVFTRTVFMSITSRRKHELLLVHGQ